MNIDFIIIIIFLFLSIFISMLLFFLILFLIYSKNDIEKSSSYECGFHSFEDNRQSFNIRFYLVSILFIIFDLEIIFLFLWVINLRVLSFSFSLVLYFILILVLGFFYEWIKGALIWE